ncbi:MAG: zinc-dependent metalloprotease [Saprospiraceae bacterium]
MNKYILLVATILLSWSLNAQPTLAPCGTPAEKSPWLIKYQKSPDQYFKNGNETIYVPLTVHIVGTDAGTGYFPLWRINNAICEVNEDFDASNIRFYVEGDFNYINNSDFYNHDFDTGFRMMQENNVNNTLNTYIVENPAGACGYAYLDGFGVALAKGCTGENDNTFAHELGHALSLPHPFVGWEGTDGDYSVPAPESLENGALVEKMDGSNCESAGDGFCDTPPDYLNYRWGCNDDGVSTRFQYDPDSVRFQSDGTLFMSYSLDQCSNRFSEEQTAAMRANLLDAQSNLLYNQTPMPAIEATELEVVSPIKDDSIAVNEVVLDWEDVPGATQYYVLIGRTPNFSVVVDRGLVTESEFTATAELTPDKKHYWRVFAFNSHEFCAEPLRGTNFFTREATTALENFTADYQISVAPTVLNSTSEVNINVQTPSAETLTATLYNIAGQAILTQDLAVFSGQNSRTLNVTDLSTGMYFLNISNGIQQRTFKLVKQ